MSVDKIPHSSWAEIYDMVYERSFGRFYHQLTEVTVDTVNSLVEPQAKIVDFGAGTGRLSIPLSNLGFEVIAVEPSRDMLRQLEKKIHHTSIKTVESTMQDFKGRQDNDLALCVFTVLLYLLNEKSLKDALASVYDSLKHDALFLIDIPSSLLFHSYSFNDEKISRSVDIKKVANDIYEYKENVTVTTLNDENIDYSDSFQIKYWEKEKVFTILKELGFVLFSDISEEFSITGSRYFVFKKN